MKNLPVKAGSFTKSSMRERDSLKNLGKEDRVSGWQDSDGRKERQERAAKNCEEIIVVEIIQMCERSLGRSS